MRVTGERPPANVACGTTGQAAASTEDPRVVRSRAKILAAASAILIEAGARGVTVDAVAERSGVAKSTLYRHWDSRADLVVDLMRANVPDLDRPDVTAGFEPALREVVASLVDWLLDPESQRIVPALFSLRHHIAEIDALTESDHAEKQQVMREVLDLGIDEGLLPTDLDPELASLNIMGPVLFAAMAGVDIDQATLVNHVVERFIASYRG